MSGMNPRLSVSTQAGPSSVRRPPGMRKRGIAQGLFVANPDNSDDEEPTPSPMSPLRGSPVTASSSSSGKSGLSIAPLHSVSGESPSVNRGSMPFFIPPPPQLSPLSSAVSISSAQSPESTALPTVHPLEAASIVQPVPPQPPPPSERLVRRSLTTPASANIRLRHGHEGRALSGATYTRGVSPSSAARPLPPISSPSLRPAVPPPFSAAALVGVPSMPPYTVPAPVTPLYAPNPNQSQQDSQLRMQHLENRTASPEDVLSPVTHMSDNSNKAANNGSSATLNKMRFGSVQSMVRLQVTTDNEQFTLVDITGMETPDAIKERVFSKVSILCGADANVSSVFAMTIITPSPCSARISGRNQILMLSPVTVSSIFAPLRAIPRRLSSSLSFKAVHQSPHQQPLFRPILLMIQT